MVDQLNGFAGEVTRVAREVGTEGKLGGQAQVPGVAGTWKDLTDNVNSMADQPHRPGPQHRRSDHRRGRRRSVEEDHRRRARRDRSRRRARRAALKRPSIRWSISERFAGEVTRVAREVGTEENWRQAQVPASPASGRTYRQREPAGRQSHHPGPQHRRVTTAVPRPALKETINTMVDQLNGFAGEVTRVAREVGTEGKLGGQAQVPGRRRHLEGLDRQRQLDGHQSDWSGAKHRRSDHRRRGRRSLEEDHRRRAR